MTTQYLGVIYDEYALSADEQTELEMYCFELNNMLVDKIESMQLSIVESAGCYVTKFSKEELDKMPTVKLMPNGKYEIVREKSS